MSPRIILRVHFCFFLLALTACAPALSPPPDGFLETVIAATVQALPTNTPYPTAESTFTPLPPRSAQATDEFTPTPFVSITPFPTFTFTPTLTETPTEVGVASRQGVYQGGGNFACMVMNQKPANWSRFRPGTIVNASWTVKNVGALEWKPNHVSIVYEEGAKIYAHKQEQELAFIVQPGETRDIIIALRMPEKGGDYQVTFGLQRGGDIFCRLIIGVSVR
jgi:hypothetical protein